MYVGKSNAQLIEVVTSNAIKFKGVNLLMISVIMSVYNEPREYLISSIESILGQTLKDFEYIIILDNPANDEAKKILESYKNDKRVSVYYNETNIGLTASLNRALKHVKGEYIARMDADDIAESDRLEVQYDYLIKNNLDLIGSPLRRINEKGNVVCEITNDHYKPETIMNLLHYDDCIAHPSWFVKKEVYQKLNGYREVYSCEDYDFLLRALKSGFKIGTAEKILLNYRINTNGISRNNSLRQLLTSDYLQKNINRINQINQKEVDNYLSKRLNEKKSEKYEKAVMLLNSIITDIKKRKLISVFKLPYTLITSSYIFINIKKIYIMGKIKKGK